jgi:capsular polysaccharide transport system ATP-binding protein
VITLEHVYKYYGWGENTKLVLNDICCVLDTNYSIGILGLNGSGKSTLIDIIAGARPPTSGKVVRATRLSWPLGLQGFSGQLTGDENIRFISRIYGVDRRKVFDFVADFSELGDDLFRPVKTYSSGMRSRLTVGVSLAIEFDVYLMDEGLSVADKRFVDRYNAAMKERFSRSRVIIVSHSMRTIAEYCSHATVLHRGTLTEVMPLAQAEQIYNGITG